ncbi:thioredoxin [Kaistella haifensis DSM 19056]|uniref:Thioredoxin n=1 Tax=Kaistella haifensis DSM 19056 TaxID=1450526 RepID=A0A246BCJ0_9FLAO|nr:TlpA disulfide reductase family protein [Kaistella haifensis]OWK99392.1 thioredoxin [Kaistella haifensis DSM 19056]
MKKILGIMSLLALNSLSAQFKIDIEAPATFTPKEVYLYTLNGSKDVLNTKEIRKGNTWQFKVEKPYTGMLKLYFPEGNISLNFISENKDVKLKFDSDKGKITNVQYLDESNFVMNNLQDVQQKKEYILPALVQIKDYYDNSTSFRKALNDEIARLSLSVADLSKYPFVQYYNSNYSKFLDKTTAKKDITHDEIIHYLSNSNDMLETSSLLRPVLMAYLNVGPSTNVANAVDKLLKAVNLETPRGQTILSELIEIFDTYGMADLKEKYLTEAKNLKCTINDRLSNTIATNKNTELGATFPNYVFQNPTNTTAKSIADVKASKKIIVFWASTCSHCEAELPKLIEKYDAIKAQNAEIIAFSLDSEKANYDAKVKSLPWINDTELKGWYSSFAETYNVRATPTYFVLDSNNKIIAKPDHAADVISYLKLN